MISYAQNFEDVILWRALGHIENGVYIDIGANDPIIDSVSMAFYERGWRGLHVEPMAEYADRLRRARPDEEVMQVAIAKSAGKVTLHEFEGTGLTTGIAAYADRHREAGYSEQRASVRSVRLSTVLKRFEGRDVHWMKVDVEGMETLVLESWGRSPVRPWVLVIESTLPLSTEQVYHDWEELVLKRGYHFVYFDGVNRFYVHQMHEDLCKVFGPGPNFFDSFFVSEHAPCAKLVSEQKQRVIAEADEARESLADMSARFDHQAATIGSAVQSAADAAHHAAAAEIERLVAQLSESQQLLDNLHRENIVKATCHAEEIANRHREIEHLREEQDRTASEHAQKIERLHEERDRAASEHAKQQKELLLQLFHRDAEIAELTMKWRRWRALAHDYRTQIDEIRSSTSWRISTPVRLGGVAGRSMKSGIKSAFRPGIDFVKKVAGRRPWLKRSILTTANLIPPVRRKIDHFWLVRQPVGVMGDDIQSHDLSLGADPESNPGEHGFFAPARTHVRLRPLSGRILSDLEAV